METVGTTWTLPATLTVGTTVVVGEMPVEAVHLVVCHHVKHPLYLAHRVEVARAVYHEASPAKLRRVAYLHASHRR